MVLLPEVTASWGEREGGGDRSSPGGALRRAEEPEDLRQSRFRSPFLSLAFCHDSFNETILEF